MISNRTFDVDRTFSTEQHAAPGKLQMIGLPKDRTVRTVVMSLSYYSVYTDITNELESKKTWKQPMWEPQQ